MSAPDDPADAFGSYTIPTPGVPVVYGSVPATAWGYATAGAERVDPREAAAAEVLYENYARNWYGGLERDAPAWADLPTTTQSVWRARVRPILDAGGATR